MLRVKVYINWAYLIQHVAGVMSYKYGFIVESIEESKDRAGNFAGTITGSILREDIAKLWNVSGVEMMMDLKT